MVAAERAVESLHKVDARTQQVAYTPITDEELDELLHRPSFESLGIPEPPFQAPDLAWNA